MGCKGLVNAVGLAVKIWIIRNRDDTRVIRDAPVETDIVPPIASEKRAAQTGRKRELGCIVDALVCLPSFKSRQDVVTQLPKPLYDRIGKVLVCVEPGHGPHASSLSRIASSISAWFLA